jgi:16S rRNA processing protein RimM
MTTLWSCGTLGKAHGLRGELYLRPGPEGLERLELGTEFFLAPRGQAPEGAERLVPCAVTRAGGTDQRPLVRLDIAAGREEAQALTGSELFAAGPGLEEVPHYRVGDLIGRSARTRAGRPLGEVADVLETPAHEVLELRTPSGGTVLVPLVDELVVLDEHGVLLVVDGLLDEEG